MSFDERKKSFETKFALDEEKEFKAKVMASKLFGQWAAEEMKMAPEEVNIYSRSIINFSITAQEVDGIIEHVKNDLLKQGINQNKTELEKIFHNKLEICKAKLAN